MPVLLILNYVPGIEGVTLPLFFSLSRQVGPLPGRFCLLTENRRAGTPALRLNDLIRIRFPSRRRP